MKAYTAGGWPQTDYALSFSGTWPSPLSTITSTQTTWLLRDADDNVWTLRTFPDPTTGKYENALPVSMVQRNGLQWTFTYGSYYDVTSITDSYGNSMTFNWIYDDPSTIGTTGDVTARAISQITLPNGDKIKYTYDTIGGGTPALPQPDRLAMVQYKNSADTVLDQTSYEYGNSSYPYAITGVFDKNGVKRWSVSYNADGQATVSEEPGGANAYSVAYAGTDTAFTRTVTNPLGKQAVYNYTNSFPWWMPKLTGVNGQASTSCPASASSLTYGSNLFIATTTDEEGHVTSYTRNARGLPTQIVEAYGTSSAKTTSITWDSVMSMPAQIVQPNLTTAYQYDTQGRLTSRTETDTTTTSVPYSTNGQQRTWAYSWSSSGQLLSVNGPLSGTGDTISYTYNSNGYLASVTNELGQTTTINTVNGRGQPTQITDPNSVVTNIAYDGLGRATSITTNPGSSQAVTSLEYNVMGDITKVTSPNGAYLQYAYDNARRVTSITNNTGEEVDYIYNVNSDVTAVNVKNSGGTIIATHTRAFDELGRVLQDIGASSQTTAYAYDKVSNRTSITDPRSKLFGHAFDPLNRLTQETDPNSYHTNVAYNGKDEVASVTDARSLATTYVRNGFGDIIRQTSPDTGTADFWYDSAGRMTKRVDARGLETDFTYDAAGRPLTKTFPASTGENVTYSYDATASGNKGVGRLTEFDDTSGATLFAYNALGQVTRERRITIGITYDTTYAYDSAGNVTQITYPSGRIVNYTHNSLGRITGITTQLNSGSSADTVASSVSYRAFGPLSGLVFGNGVNLAIGRDGDNQITSINASTASVTVQDLSYGYDAAGNITSIADNYQTARNQTFGYDNLNRLASAGGPYGSLSFSYDGVGNRLTRVAGSTTGTYAYSSSSNRLSSVTTGSTVRSFSYLGSGQVSQDARDASNTYSFNYNDNGRMSSASLSGGQVGTYIYNGIEQRVAKTVGGATTHYLFDRFGHLLAENDAMGMAQKEYIWLDDLPLAVIDNTGASPVTYYIHTDHLGRPQKLTDASASLAWDAIFQPFGGAYAVSGAASNFLLFPGQFYDGETQLSQNWHRDYDATIGRYIQSDPIGLAGGINTYGYVGGNPILRTDPSGKIWPQVIVGMIAAGAAIYEWYEYNSHPTIPLRRRPPKPTGLCTFDNPTGEPERPELRNAGPIIPFSGNPEPPELESFPER